MNFLSFCCCFRDLPVPFTHHKLTSATLPSEKNLPFNFTIHLQDKHIFNAEWTIILGPVKSQNVIKTLQNDHRQICHFDGVCNTQHSHFKDSKIVVYALKTTNLFCNFVQFMSWGWQLTSFCHRTLDTSIRTEALCVVLFWNLCRQFYLSFFATVGNKSVWNIWAILNSNFWANSKALFVNFHILHSDTYATHCSTFHHRLRCA